MYVYIYTCLCIYCIYLCMYVYTHVYIHLYVFIYVYVCLWLPPILIVKIYWLQQKSPVTLVFYGRLMTWQPEGKIMGVNYCQTGGHSGLIIGADQLIIIVWSIITDLGQLRETALHPRDPVADLPLVKFSINIIKIYHWRTNIKTWGSDETQLLVQWNRKA